jgi:hypothetical protein
MTESTKFLFIALQCCSDPQRRNRKNGQNPFKCGGYFQMKLDNSPVFQICAGASPSEMNTSLRDLFISIKKDGFSV